MMENSLKCTFFHKKIITYGICHAGFSVFDSILLQNETDAPLSNLLIRVTSVPEIFSPAECEVSYLAPGAFRALSCEFIRMDEAYLESVKEVHSVRLEIRITDAEGETLFVKESGVQWVPYTHFCGFSALPESLAFFVSPHQKEVEEFARSLGASKGMDLVRACYEKFKELKFTYSAENYFDPAPIRLRFPEEVLRRQAGNALELSVLFASVMEERGEKCSLFAAPKGKVFVAVEAGAKPKGAVTLETRSRKDLSGYLFLDGSFLAYGSEWNFDHALYESKNFLELCDEKIVAVHIAEARKNHLIPLPDRVYDGARAAFDAPSPAEEGGSFSEYYDLLQRYASDERITAILTGKKIAPSASKSTVSFDPSLDVNQNKLLNRILNTDFTLIRAQHSTGATALFARAAYYALKAKKSVLYIPDPKHNTGDFAAAVAEEFDPAFVLDLTRRSPETLKEVRPEAFSGFFKEHNTLFDEKDAVRSSYEAMDHYYASLEGGKGITSSFLSAADRCHQFRSASNLLVFAPEQIGLLSDEMIQLWFNTVQDTVKSAEEAGGAYQNPLEFIRRKDFSYEYKSRLISQLENLLHSLEAFLQARSGVEGFLRSLPLLNTPGKTQAFCDLVHLFLSFNGIPHAFFEDPFTIEENFQTLTHILQAKSENDQIRDLISISFEPTIFDLPAEETYEKWKEYSADKSLKGISQKHSLQKNVKRYLKPNCDVENIGYVLARLESYRENEFLIREKEAWAFKLIGVDPESDNAWRVLKEQSDLCYQGYSIFTAAFPGDNIAPVLGEIAQISERGELIAACEKLQDSYADFLSCKRGFETLAQNDLERALLPGGAEGGDFFAPCYEELTRVLSSMDRLKAWCDWLLRRDTCIEIGLKNVVLALETGRVKPQDMKKTFIRAFFKGICEYNFIQHPELVPGAFYFAEKKAIIEENRKKLSVSQKAELDSLLSIEKLNAIHELPAETDLREAVRSHMRLFTALYPVVIADAASAKRLFADASSTFDLVLVESRSKIRMDEFIWMLSTSRHLAFAGNFAAGYRAAEQKMELSASAFDFLWQITEEKYNLSSVYGQTPAMTSYRAALSCARRADTRCYSVPAPAASAPIEIRHVRGFFDQEIPLVNAPEAEAIVQELLEKAEELKEKSVSVVCGTVQQKDYILRTLASRLYHDKEKAASLLGGAKKLYLTSFGKEIRSADVLYVSPAFAVDRSMYGSRLPYSFSRCVGTDPKTALADLLAAAKEKMILFTSFTADDLAYSGCVLETDLSFRLLYSLLELPANNSSYEVEDPMPLNSFIKRMAVELKEKGFDFVLGVQSGRFYLDLAVKDEKGDFVLGVISDHSVLNQKANISAIEMQNEAAYEKAGWRIYRLRTPECFDHFSGVMEEVFSFLTPPEKKDWE